MPTYDYENCRCESGVPEVVELTVPIAQRDNINCDSCGKSLKRIISFNGLTWAPTAGGMR